MGSETLAASTDASSTMKTEIHNSNSFWKSCMLCPPGPIYVSTQCVTDFFGIGVVQIKTSNSVWHQHFNNQQSHCLFFRNELVS